MLIKAPAIMFKQGKKTMYLSVLPAGEIVDKTHVDRYNPNTRTGYQRDTKPQHVTSISKYVQRKDAIMPLPGVLSLRDSRDVHFEPIQGGDSESGVTLGELCIGDGGTIYVIDMQHRRDGFAKAFDSKRKLRSYRLPIVVIEDLEMADEALQFYIMNIKQKRLESDLAKRVVLEHFSIREIRELTELEDWEIKAVKIAIEINKDISIDNPWGGKIKQPNSPRGGYLATEKTFVRSLENLLVDSKFKGNGVKKLTGYVIAYWHALRDLFPAAFMNARQFRLQKYATSLVAFHMVMPLLLDEARKKGKLSPPSDLHEYLVSRLEPLKVKLGLDYWSKSNTAGVISYGTGYGAEGRLAAKLAEILGIEL